MPETTKNLTSEQQFIVKELTRIYDIEPEEIIFFTDKPQPFFMYEAACILCNRLTDLYKIVVEPMAAQNKNSIAVRCILESESGERTGFGVANTEETINGVKMSDTQLIGLANARALRNALRTAGIDLYKAHIKAQSTGETSGISDGDEQKVRNQMLAEAHALGAEAGLISGTLKTAWRRQLAIRFDGIESTADLSPQQLTDWIAFLRTLVPTKSAAV